MMLNAARCVMIVLLLCSKGFAQKQWAGASGSAWSSGVNWQPFGVPAASDDVVLDNAICKTDYTVVLPDTAVAIHSLLIAPATGNHIKLILPVTNNASPALQAGATGDAIVIRSGGSFANASGLNGGSSLMLNGMLRIEHNGRYTHNTRATHATDIVARLSSAAGTEDGIFEFDVPGGSYPISLSNRTYGRLVLSSTASGGTQTYNASGTSPLTISSDLEMNAGVTLNIDFTQDIIINGNLVQNGGTLNLASQPNHNTVKIKGDLSQQSGGIITETSTGLPVIELAGNTNQQVLLSGSMRNSITLRMNNPQGATLAGPVLLPFKLELLKGKIKTSTANLLMLSAACQITGASVQSFINGPVEKTGAGDFEFPVGKQGDYAPVTISGAGGAVTDAFRAEYFLSNPQAAYGPAFEKPVIKRISTLEYWQIEQKAGTSAKKITVCVGPYSNATALDKLAVAWWDSGTATWMNAGNTLYNGIAMGNITSEVRNGFGSFTLASTEEAQNLLPLTINNLTPNRRAPAASFHLVNTLVTQAASVSVASPHDELIQIVITDAYGKKVKALQQPVHQGTGSMSLNLSDLARGIYTLSITDMQGNKYAVRLFKQ